MVIVIGLSIKTPQKPGHPIKKNRGRSEIHSPLRSPPQTDTGVDELPEVAHFPASLAEQAINRECPVPYPDYNRGMFLRRFIALSLLVLILAGCGPVPVAAPTETVAATATSLPTATSTPTATPVPPTPTSIPALTLWLDPSLPDALSEGLTVPADIETTAREAESTYRWVLLDLGETAAVETDWVFVAAAAFPTIPGEVSGAKLRGQWQRGGGQALLVSQDTLAAFTALWGKPAVGAVKVLAEEALLDAAWEKRGQVALLPFEQLSPRWKALRVDGLSPFDRDFDAAAYPLALRAGLRGAEALPEGWVLPQSNYDPSKMTTLMLTGVTALARRTAKTINEQGAAFLAARYRRLVTLRRFDPC